ncbi:myoglobin-like [Babylonia areolata]|uniref:myoglobin-like n=1 Tax=Babylonia areolata TaxID=304850 RepID=UPI003FCF7F1E
MNLDLEECCVSETTGLCLENPLTMLPDYFAPWHRLATEMPQRIADGSMRQETLQMPLLDWARLEGHRQQRLAHLQLGIITMGYVWQDGDEGAAKVLPACVAVPLCGLSKELGIMPVLTHSALILANYRLIDPTKTLELDNMSALYCLPGGKESEWFTLVSTAIEIDFGKGTKALLAILEGVKSGDEKSVSDGLVKLTYAVDAMTETSSRTHEKLSPATFFNTLRLYLRGWGGEDNPLPDGLIYEGVSDQPLQYLYLVTLGKRLFELGEVFLHRVPPSRSFWDNNFPGTQKEELARANSSDPEVVQLCGRTCSERLPSSQ